MAALFCKRYSPCLSQFSENRDVDISERKENEE